MREHEPHLMRVVLDPAPLTDPDLFDPEERRSMIVEVMETTDSCLGDIARHLDAGDLAAARRAAHWARNNALSVGAAAFARALSDVEAACREAAPKRAGAAAARMHAVWPPTREAIAGLLV